MDILHYIQWCFFGFGLYNLIYLILKSFAYLRKKINFKTIDKAARYTLLILACIYILTYILNWVVIFSNPNNVDNAKIISRLTGRYSYGLYAQQIYYFTTCLSFTIPLVNRNTFLRILFGSMLLFNFEKFIIIVTSLHRDYLPSFWSIYGGNLFGYLILDWIIKLVLFLSLTTVSYLLINRKVLFK